MKAKIILYIVFLSLLLVQNDRAQTSERQNNAVGFSIGLTNYSVKDQLASPLTYSGIYVPFGFSYSFKSPKNYHRVSLRYGHTKLESAIASYYAHNAEFYSGNLQYEYARFITDFFDNKLSFYCGVEWNNNIAIRAYNFNKYDGEVTGEIISSISLLVLGNYEYSQETNMRFSLSLPMLNYVIRSPYSLKDEPTLKAITENSPIRSVAKLGEFHSLKNLAAIKTSFLLIHQISSSFDFRLKWELLYFWFREPKAITYAVITYDVRVMYRF